MGDLSMHALMNVTDDAKRTRTSMSHGKAQKVFQLFAKHGADMMNGWLLTKMCTHLQQETGEKPFLNR